MLLGSNFGVLGSWGLWIFGFWFYVLDFRLRLLGFMVLGGYVNMCSFIVLRLVCLRFKVYVLCFWA